VAKFSFNQGKLNLSAGYGIMLQYALLKSFWLIQSI